jgi:ABC-type Fe3+ transport system permease subunit
MSPRLPPTPGKFSAPHHRVQLAGALIVVVGMIVAAFVWFAAARDGEGDGTGDVTSQREMQQVERLGGRATVQTVQFDSWLGSLWHGQRLAWTLAILSLAVGGGCAWIGALMGEEVDE